MKRKNEADLARAQVEYTPSIGNFDPNDKDAYKYRPLHAATSDVRMKVKRDLEEIAALCKSRIIRPKDSKEYERLREAELAQADKATPQTGLLYAAGSKQKKKADSGAGDVLEYGDLVSKVAEHSRQLADNAIEEEEFASHPHLQTETVLYDLPAYDMRSNRNLFNSDEMFTLTLILNNNATWCALSQMSEYESCERELGKLKDYAPLKMTKRFGEFVTHFGIECGLRLFRTHVRRDHPNTLFASFELDAMQRYFCTMVFSVEKSFESARDWCSEALAWYNKLMNDARTASSAFKPCEEFASDTSEWSLYQILASKTLQNTSATFEYAFYTTCQCVDLTNKT